MLSKRVLARSFYETTCPNCQYRTMFTPANIIRREYRNACSEKKDYDVISYDVKCQLCMSRFQPTNHRAANFFQNPMKEYLLTPDQVRYISRMKSYTATIPTGVGGIRLGQSTDELRHEPKYDDVSVFMVDEIASGPDAHVCITGHNLSEPLLRCALGLDNIREIPITMAMDFHFNWKPHMVGDVTHVTKS